MTEYFWYNGSTSFVDGEELKWWTRRPSEIETDEESERENRLPIAKTRNEVSYS